VLQRGVQADDGSCSPGVLPAHRRPLFALDAAPNGSLDASLDGDGRVLTDLDLRVAGLAPRSIFAGWHDPGGGRQRDEAGRSIVLARYSPTGNLDPALGGGGMVTPDLGSVQVPFVGSATIVGDRVVAAATIVDNPSNPPGLMAFDAATGSPDFPSRADDVTTMAATRMDSGDSTVGRRLLLVQGERHHPQRVGDTRFGRRERCRRDQPRLSWSATTRTAPDTTPAPTIPASS
jgi:hypothetical protein